MIYVSSVLILAKICSSSHPHLNVLMNKTLKNGRAEKKVKIIQGMVRHAMNTDKIYLSNKDCVSELDAFIYFLQGPVHLFGNDTLHSI
jgi:hypothetical protein